MPERGHVGNDRLADGRNGRIPSERRWSLRGKQPIDPLPITGYPPGMKAVEFTTELNSAGVLKIPSDAAAQLPKAGKARVIVLTDEHTDDPQWRLAAYQQFLRDDAAEDAIYDSCR